MAGSTSASKAGVSETEKAAEGPLFFIRRGMVPVERIELPTFGLQKTGHKPNKAAQLATIGTGSPLRNPCVAGISFNFVAE
jgi:hypothetical protein